MATKNTKIYTRITELTKDKFYPIVYNDRKFFVITEERYYLGFDNINKFDYKIICEKYGAKFISTSYYFPTEESCKRFINKFIEPRLNEIKFNLF
jgi:hypothetical protein